MSTFEDKVTATYDFLVNRASQGARLTSHQEVGTVIGVLLNERRQRRISTPVARAKVIKVLKAVDDLSVERSGVMLSALVTHFWDAQPGSRFIQSAASRGLFNGGDAGEFHKAQLAQIKLAYPSFVGVNQVRDAVDLDDYEEDFEEDDEVSEGTSVSRLRQLIREEISKVKSPF